MESILVTGGAGFIGANFVHYRLGNHKGSVVNLDKLTYAGNPQNLSGLESESRYRFEHGDICDGLLVAELLRRDRPRAIVHFAAESHVDRSINSPDAFIRTNVNGTFTLLEAARVYYTTLEGEAKSTFRFLHVSTDEVYGSLTREEPAFTETTAYAPNSPYSASKAASDHLVRAYFHTYGLPVLTTNCSNNYGPYQFPEKLIPLTILNALNGRPIPVYGDGLNIRDWLYVVDHCSAIAAVLAGGWPGEVYNIGGNCEKTNIEIVRAICAILDELQPQSAFRPHAQLITYVTDRPGHDRRYAIDNSKILSEIGWQPRETLESGLAKTVEWYLNNPGWVQGVTSGAYRQWIEDNYGRR